MRDIKLFTLVNGFEIIGRVQSDEPTYYLIEEPYGLQLNQIADGTFRIALIPYSPIAQDGIHKFHKHAICSECLRIPSDVEKNYIQKTSKIQIVGGM